MAKLRHIALAAEDPYVTAEFYKKAFDFVEVRRTEPRGEGTSHGVFLSDGTISLAILRFGWDQGHGLDFRGIHHFGVLVDHVDPYVEKLERLGAECFARRPPDVKSFYETKFHGPDRVVFDITDHPWRGAAPLDADNVPDAGP
jgi:catechol 2,3-dioxygenase-like lactoylglutathione lyase family enzyme